jgi:hypothetical protein
MVNPFEEPVAGPVAMRGVVGSGLERAVADRSRSDAIGGWESAFVTSATRGADGAREFSCITEHRRHLFFGDVGR